MDTFKEFLHFLFGDSVAVSDVLAAISVVLTPVITVFFNKAKNKMLALQKSSDVKDVQIAEQSKQIDKLKESVSYLGNIVATAYLSSNTVPPEVKKQIATYTTYLDKAANIELTKTTEQLLTTITQYVPDLNDKKQEILEATTKAEEFLDEVNDKTIEAIDKLKLD